MYERTRKVDKNSTFLFFYSLQVIKKYYKEQRIKGVA